MRSLLCVPGRSERAVAAGMASDADVLILDLAASSVPREQERARQLAREAVADAPHRIAVSVNPLNTCLTAVDLAAVMPARPHTIVLPRSECGADVAHLAAMIAVAEAEAGIADGTTRILALTTANARALFGLGTYETAGRRLAAMAWTLADLAVALGARRTHGPDGQLTQSFALARTLTLAGARTAGVTAIDAPHGEVRDEAGLHREARDAAQDGFRGKLAVHPAQVPVINEAFTACP